MCRWPAYCGEPLRPSELILHPQHSLIAQSLDSPLGAETVNGDGFGFGWYPAGGRGGNVPAVFRSVEPAWNDQNLRELTGCGVRKPSLVVLACGLVSLVSYAAFLYSLIRPSTTW